MHKPHSKGTAMESYKKRIRLYVAGQYSADNVIDVLKNIGKGRKACAELFQLGFSPFCPWHDAAFIIDNPDAFFTVEQFYRYSIEWLKVSDAVLLLPGWKLSKGTLAEIKIAEELGIPIFTDRPKLVDFAMN